MWVADVNAMESAVNYFTTQGYDADDLVLIPFTSKYNWVKSYPYAVPSLECDDEGQIVDFAFDSSPSSEKKKPRRRGRRLWKQAVLTNDTRDELHIQIYKYFRWFLHQLNNLKSTAHGRVVIRESGLKVAKVQTIVEAFQSAFVAITYDSTMSEIGTMLETDKFPLLEQALECELGIRADERLGLSESSQSNYPQKHDFDHMFDMLVDYKREKGNCNVPARYKDNTRLGIWVSKLREKKRELVKSGNDFETIKRGKITQLTLTQDRLDRLNSIGFEWCLKKTPDVSWDTRFHELIEYYQAHGRWPNRKKSGSLGQWTHHQRNMYSKKDKLFMKERFAKLDAIGFDWDPTGLRSAKEINWDDGFQQLVCNDYFTHSCLITPFL